ncbi:MAG: hypothetical protein MUE44_02835 [Oscillatoriaceae cyanobacterium Prado104]|jgi:hypothetical protein|nr:hypothetical protein [Oscillatoriaceae cyanobacterium Prado104]
MNLYFLVEGTHSERKIYPAWLDYLLPELQRVYNYYDANVKNYYLISGQGYPSFYNFITTSVQEINSTGKYNYFVLCLDADENTVSERHAEINDFLTNQKLELKKTELVLIVQNRCLESWLLGNRKIYTKNPQDPPLLDYTKYYDVSVNCPENMGKYPDFNTHAQFHAAYLRKLFEAKNTSYSKKDPGDARKEFYLNQLLERIKAHPEHLITFRYFIEFCNKIKVELQN